MTKAGTQKINDDKQWLVESLHMANIGNWQWDILSDVVTWSDELYKIYGLDMKSFGTSFSGYLERIHPDDRERVKKTIQNALKEKNKVTFEERIVRPDGEIRYLRSWGAVKTNEQDQPDKMYGACIDITETKLKDIALKQKEKEFATILERVTDAFVAIDADWNYTYVNKKAAELFHREPELLIGRNIWVEFPEGVGQPFHKAYIKAMETQKYQHLQAFYPPYNKWFVNHIYPSPDGLTIYFEDITVQKNLEDALKKYKDELEEKVKARTSELEEQNIVINKQKDEIEDIIKELHHRVKNNMQIISSLLNLQSNMVDDPKTKQLFLDCQNRVYSMALIHKKMYQSNNLTKVNARDYIPDLIKSIIESSSLTKKIDLEFNIEPIEFNTKMMVPIGLLVNEIILNSIKHAFKNQAQPKIFYELTCTDNKCRMIVGDNGIGINKSNFLKSGSLGMDIIEAFSTQIEGTVNILDLPGTVYEIIFENRNGL